MLFNDPLAEPIVQRELARTPDDDRREDEEFQARIEQLQQQSRSLKTRSGSMGLVRKTTEQPAPEPQQTKVAANFRESLLNAGAMVIVELRDEWEREMQLIQAQSREIIAE